MFSKYQVLLDLWLQSRFFYNEPSFRVPEDFHPDPVAQLCLGLLRAQRDRRPHRSPHCSPHHSTGTVFLMDGFVRDTLRGGWSLPPTGSTAFNYREETGL